MKAARKQKEAFFLVTGGDGRGRGRGGSSETEIRSGGERGGQLKGIGGQRQVWDQSVSESYDDGRTFQEKARFFLLGWFVLLLPNASILLGINIINPAIRIDVVILRVQNIQLMSLLVRVCYHI